MRALLTTTLLALAALPALANDDGGAPPECATVEECGRRGVAARLGTDGVKQDMPVARALLERACDLGGGRVAPCTDLAEMVNSGFGGPREEPRARAILDRACQAREASACAFLGLIFTEGLGAPYRPEYFRVGARLFKRACELGRAGACWHYGSLLRGGHGVARDPALATRFFRRACQLGDRSGCDELRRTTGASGEPR